ncbi:MAG TPA: BamA/TamA family outer membrane protein [Gemmatimonadaceae bacterium]|nr:BamA/TamA family outer membrane protein [Gemmatimonadaceae bacterium]
MTSRASWFAFVAAAALSAAAPRASAQRSPMVLPPGTRVRSIDFRWVHDHTIDAVDLRQHIATVAPEPEGIFGGVLDFLFRREKPPMPLFDPLELERDAVRIRDYYQTSGILHANVGFAVKLDTSDRRVDVVFVIDEGKPTLLRSVRIEPGDSTGVDSATTLPPDIIRAARHAVAPARNHRFGSVEASTAERRTRVAMRNLGYAFAGVWSRSLVDTTADTATLELRLRPGPRAKIARIDVTGNDLLSDHVIKRELPFHVGNYYTASEMSEGRRSIQGLDIIREARVELAPGQKPDSQVAIRVTVAEQPVHVITGETGYSSENGATAQVTWTHRNFTNDARTLTTSLGTSTAWLAVDQNPERFVRGVATLKQPYVYTPPLSALLSPFAEYRDDFRDRSWAIGSDATLLYRLGPVFLMSLKYSISSRHVLRYRNGDFSSGRIDFLTLLAQNALLGSLKTTTRRSTLTLNATLGALDNANNPRDGFVLRPSIESTAGSALNTVEYTRLDLTGAAYHPINRRVGIAVRFSAGRLYPRGKSLGIEGSDSTLKFLELRDVAFTAGGAADVRGWSSGLLGPKFPDLRFQVHGTDTTAVATGYVPIGGLARVAGTFELRMPFPGLGDSWGTHAFIDGGRVWTPDKRFKTSFSLPGDDRFFTSVGAGVDYLTVIGAVRVSIGYKLNPSLDDVRDPQKVLDAIIAGTPIANVPTQWYRRFQIHLALGTAF